ncbi:hypothetical protein DPMN_174309 [Dreissena polymorpha]|uniref:Uncharacterized protein n=1 Tax=Dreissena polymorpha TaxID=45954 RepID=A0A9D4E622_DREPO|nr:hypothetical protein DPMN_174309 [Dreissena polymorpha]
MKRKCPEKNLMACTKKSINVQEQTKESFTTHWQHMQSNQLKRDLEHFKDLLNRSLSSERPNINPTDT